ncbi:hypothetical protein HY734_03645 [Candidatus Uhrbacteria bacterium]|nr:hypothetical protein [Candidatus Uhrbacteria bacterium]
MSERPFHETMLEILNVEKSERRLQDLFLKSESITEVQLEVFVDGLEKEMREQISSIASEDERISVVLTLLQRKTVVDPRAVIRSIKERGGFAKVAQEEDDGEVELDIRTRNQNGGVQREYLWTDDADVEVAVQQLQRGILTKLRHRFRQEVWEDRMALHALSHIIKVGEVFKLLGGDVMKITPEWMAPYVQANHRALKRLYTLPERSPYVSYALLEREVGEVDGVIEAFEIQRNLNFDTLDALLYDQAGPPSLVKTVGYVFDYVRGLVFLFERGFALTDNTLDNIGVSRENGTGFVFDFGALFQAADAVPAFITKKDYGAPEVRQNRLHPASEAGVAYEIGACLHFIHAAYSDLSLPFSERMVLRLVSVLAHDLTEEKPQFRLPLFKVLQNLEYICQEIKRVGLDADMAQSTSTAGKKVA